MTNKLLIEKAYRNSSMPFLLVGEFQIQTEVPGPTIGG
jgi:hypothetical protein